ncbi:MAG: hypothetical protein ABH815_02920 [Candidatus Omnitrophota bacterium]
MKEILKNEVMKKIVLFFNENQHSIDTAKGISVWIGCDSNKVQRSLDKLVKKGILINHKTVSTDAYSYTTERDIIKKIEKYIKTLA